ncbi:MAG: SIS domain-containing protein [Nocardioidaceae bacterium]
MRFPDGIDAQPAVLAQSARTVQAGLAEVAPLARDAVVALTGIGASEHISRSAAVAWRAAGLRAVAVPASELMEADVRLADAYVALSESGRSAETVAALTKTSTRSVGVTNVADSPLAGVVDELLLLDSGPDSPVYTTGYTATLQAIGMLGEHWSGRATDWSALPDLTARVLEASNDVVDRVVETFGRARIIDVVGSGSAAATAGEGALVLREAARAHTAAHETYNYLHGPMEPLDPETACLVVGDGREVRVAQDVSALGCPTVLLTTRTDVAATENLTVLQLPVAPSPLAAAALQILPVQVLAWRLADSRGLAVDGFRYHQDDTKLATR